jgi:microcin C transport system substrate-binding protein
LEITRRAFGLLTGGAAAALTAFGARAQDPGWRHGTALAGDPRYAEGFTHFDYVNPEAPKGGVARLSSGGAQTFDTFNPLLSRGVPGAGLGLVLESLMTSSLDEQDISAMYGLLAEAMRYPEDLSSVTYRLNPAARWHDGEPVTADDVVWSFQKTIELSPYQADYYKHVVSAEATADNEVTFTFDETGNRELPHIVGQLMVLPRHWWEGADANGRQRDIAAGTLEPPLGSGPYRIARFTAGRSITYERVPDYWGADLAVNVGQNNFDEVRYEYYRDVTVQFEAFKADEFDYWWENQASRWETQYDFPAIADGRVKREEVELDQASGTMVGFFINVRRARFQDVRVRRALNYCFDFEELNRTQFYGKYQRVDSYFYGLPLRWEGLPQGRELEILEEVRDQVAPEVFTTEYANPVGGDPQRARENLRAAVDLFREAGYTLEGGRMVGPDGQPFTIEVLLNGPTIERVVLPFQQALGRIGVQMTVRPVDSNQFVSRVYGRDFDLVYLSLPQSTSPGNEQLSFFGSAAADQDSTPNYSGIKDPAVDALIQRIVFAPDRETLVAAVKALDRVLMWSQYVIPSYYRSADWIAYWDRFGHPDPYPRFSIGFPTVWWWDEAKAAAIGSGR